MELKTKTLKISKDLQLPRQAVTSTIIIYGGKGMGKTNLGSVIVEEVTKNFDRWCVLDPMGVWWGLRHSSDGKGSGIECVILGGAHGDIPIEPTGGAIVADLVIDEGVNTIIDFSRKANGQMWSVGEKIRFVTEYTYRLFQRQGELVGGRRREPLMQVLDEAARYIPQVIPSGGIDLAKCVSAWEQVVEEGRNIGLGVTLLTQRSARMNKSVSELADVMFAFRTIGPNSLAAVMDWLGEHVEKNHVRELSQQVRELDVGQALVVSPGWLKIEKIATIRMRETFDSSSTPKPGQKARRVTGKAAKPDLAKYQQKMSETIEKVKQEDPKLLNQKIISLNKELEIEKRKSIVLLKDPATMGKEIEKAVRETERKMNIEFMAERDEFLRHIKNMFKIIETVAITVKDIKMPDFKKISTKTKEYKDIFDTPSPSWMSKKGERLSYKMDSVVIPPSMQKTAEKIINSVPDNTGGTITAGAKNMLKVLVSRYPMKLTWVQVATFAKLKSSTGSYSTNKTSLRNAGMIIEEGDLVQASQAAIDLMGHEVSAPQSSQEIREMWSNSFTGATKKMFDHLVSVYPGIITREELAAAAGVKHTTGSYSTNLSMLRSNNLIEERDQELKLNDNLFI